MAVRKNEKCECGGTYYWNKYCGSYVCNECGDHKGLGNCYCGWRRGGHLQMPTGDEPIDYEKYSEYLLDYIYDNMYHEFEAGTERPMDAEKWHEKVMEDLGKAIYEAMHDL